MLQIPLESLREQKPLCLSLYFVCSSPGGFEADWPAVKAHFLVFWRLLLSDQQWFCETVFKSVFMNFKQLANANTALFAQPALASHTHRAGWDEEVVFCPKEDGTGDVAAETGLLTT